MSRNSNKKIQYADLWGLREEKYQWLDSHDFSGTPWQELDPKSPHYFFIPKNDAGWEQYQNFWKITDIFPVNSVGIVTARDDLTIGWTENEIWNRVSTFANYEPEEARTLYQLGKDAQDWRIELAQQDISGSGPKKELITPITYRPFDVRYTYYTGKSRGFICRPRTKVMQHIIKSNLALMAVRQVFKSDQFAHVFVSDHIVDINSLHSPGVEVTFPLYLHNITQQGGLFAVPKIPNFGKKFTDSLNQNIALKMTPEDIFYYIYAVLYSNTYRQKYAEFLKVDFPKIPFTKDYPLFLKLAELGGKLVDLHLLKIEPADQLMIQFTGQDSGKVDRVEWVSNEIWINDTQRFTPVPEKVWNYHIGGYQVLHKWLKDRKGKYLSNEEIKTYCRIATALKSTIEIQKEIDKLYPKVEESLINHESLAPEETKIIEGSGH